MLVENLFPKNTAEEMDNYVLMKYLPCVVSKHPSLGLHKIRTLGPDGAFIVLKESHLLTSQETFFIFILADA